MVLLLLLPFLLEIGAPAPLSAQALGHGLSVAIFACTGVMTSSQDILGEVEASEVQGESEAEEAQGESEAPEAQGESEAEEAEGELEAPDVQAEFEELDVIQMGGVVLDKLSNTLYRVELENGHEITGHITNRLRTNNPRIVTGDQVTVEVFSYTSSLGYIVAHSGI